MEKLIHILKSTENILLDKDIISIMKELKPDAKNTVSTCVLNEVPIPCLSEALHFLNGYTTKNSSANLIQAQRDYFGAHTYQRVDDSSGKFHHTNWQTSTHD